MAVLLLGDVVLEIIVKTKVNIEQSSAIRIFRPYNELVFVVGDLL